MTRPACSTSAPPSGSRTQNKAPDLPQVNHAVLAHAEPEPIAVEIPCGRTGGASLSAERDDMELRGKKAHPRWLGHAIDHHTGKVLAYVFGRRQDNVFLGLQALLEPFGITRYDTDGWGTYARHVDAERHLRWSGTQAANREPAHLRTRVKRLVRRTICLSSDGA